MNILVTDGENRSALALTRSLGRKGSRVFVAAKYSNCLSGASKYCFKSFITPDPLRDSTEYAKSIVKISKEECIDVIFPMTEQSIYSINKSRTQFADNLILACANHEKMDAVSNKFDLFKKAEKLGVAIPETIYISDSNDFYAKKGQISKFPVVIKPALSKIDKGEEIISTGVKYAANKNELIRLYETNPDLRCPSLIQEKIIGLGTGLFTLFDRDRHLALFSHRRLLEKPPSGGVSVISESIALDPEMVNMAEKLLAEVQWEGVAMVEFKRDKRDGKAKLMEINGRFWGSLQLALSAGVDFPALSLDYHVNKQPTSLLAEYNVGHKLKWYFGILDHLIMRMNKGGTSPMLSPEYPSRWEVAKELLTVGDVNTSVDVYDSDDMQPFFEEVKAYMKNLFR